MSKNSNAPAQRLLQASNRYLPLLLVCVILTAPVAATAQSCTTTISGVVYAPNGVDPLPNVLVYIPSNALQPFPNQLVCDQGGSTPPSGSPLALTYTSATGGFTLTNVRAGTGVRLVMQVGKWRRQVVLPTVTACQNTVAPASLTRLPKDKTQGIYQGSPS